LFNAARDQVNVSPPLLNFATKVHALSPELSLYIGHTPSNVMIRTGELINTEL
jgi:hypothetical protein